MKVWIVTASLRSLCDWHFSFADTSSSNLSLLINQNPSFRPRTGTLLTDPSPEGDELVAGVYSIPLSCRFQN